MSHVNPQLLTNGTSELSNRRTLVIDDVGILFEQHLLCVDYRHFSAG